MDQPRIFVVPKLVLFFVILTTAHALDGTWELLVPNAGVSAMHGQLTRYGTCILFDRTNAGPSQILLANGRCRDNPADQRLKHDCTAHSIEFTPGTNRVRPLFIFTDTWCSSGQVRQDGTLWQTGGDTDGLRKIRTFNPCPPGGTCDWVETTTPLLAGRWYATNHILEDGTEIVIGGRGVFTMEFVPDNGRGQTQIQLLVTTNNFENDNYYPYVNLLPNGYLWIFANQDSIIYDYKGKRVVKQLPRLPGGPRNYPSAGSSVMLPLQGRQKFGSAVCIVCGGAQLGAFINPGPQFAAQQTCGRITVTAANPTWAIETMPYRRTMGDMLILPSQDVLIVNGAENGSQGWGEATNPVLNPVLYRPGSAVGSRFVVQAPSTIPRMYHSIALLLQDGRVLVAGSNSHQFYTFTGAFPTDLRIEAFSPRYLSAANRPRRPVITGGPAIVTYGSTFTLTFTLATPPGTVLITMGSAPFVTHSYAQGQRLLVLVTGRPVATAAPNTYTVTATAPPTASIAPGSYYMTYVVNSGIPSASKWIQLRG